TRHPRPSADHHYTSPYGQTAREQRCRDYLQQNTSSGRAFSQSGWAHPSKPEIQSPARSFGTVEKTTLAADGIGQDCQPGCPARPGKSRKQIAATVCKTGKKRR